MGPWSTEGAPHHIVLGVSRPLGVTELSECLQMLVLFYMNKVMRGPSICSTCLLRMLQAIVLRSSTSWTGLNRNPPVPSSIPSSVSSQFVFCRTLSPTPWFLMCQDQSSEYHKYFFLSLTSDIIQSLFSVLPLLRDDPFSGIMLLSSVGIRGSPSTSHYQPLLTELPKKKDLLDPLAAGEFFYGQVLCRLHHCIFFNPNMGICFRGLWSIFIATVNFLVLIRSHKSTINMMQNI